MSLPLAAFAGGVVTFPELIPLRPAERAILGPVPCQGCGADVAFTLPDPPLSFIGSWRSARARNNLGQLIVATFAHDCPGTLARALGRAFPQRGPRP
jgi:hypothetical protein